jgi:alpha-tubulin suppressor-like RCC1 family protein
MNRRRALIGLTLTMGLLLGLGLISLLNFAGWRVQASAAYAAQAAAPEISVEQPLGTVIADGGSKDFGTLIVGTNNTRTFTIKNTGNALLNLTGNPKVVIGGAHAADFTVTTQPGSPVPVGNVSVQNGGFETPEVMTHAYAPSGASWTFINFDGSTSSGIARNGSDWYSIPAPQGAQAAFISREGFFSQAINFPALGDYVIHFSMIKGSNSSANNIAVKMDGTTLGTFTNQEESEWRTFSVPYTCTAAGNHTLTFAGTGNWGGSIISVIDDVQVTSHAGIFQVAFAPSAGGTRTATLSIANNDNDETPYNITLTGTGITRPEISLEQPAGTPLVTGQVVAWGYPNGGQTNVPGGLEAVKAIASGGQHMAVLKGDGTVVTWGNTSAVPEGLTNVVAIEAGRGHTVALKSDGTVVAWGLNNGGQTNVPPGLTGVVAIAADTYGSSALKSDGTIVKWGLAAEAPPAGLTNVVDIAMGTAHILALKGDGTVLAWGQGINGETSVPPGLTGVTAIAARDYGSFAVKSDGTVVAWGSNGSPPAGLTGVVNVAMGIGHFLALKNDGTVFAWGENDYGQATVPPGLKGMRAISANNALGNRYLGHSAALTDSSVDFGNQSPGTASAAKTFTIKNTGTAPLTISNVSVSGGQASNFTVNTSGMLTTVPINGQTTFRVTFTPSSLGAKQTTLRVLNNDSDEGSFYVHLTGVGIDNAPTINATTVTRQQGSPAANAQIATVQDAEDAENTLTVRVEGGTTATENGVTVSNLAVNAAGQVTASVVATCTASNANFTLTVTDSAGATANATLNVTVTANAAPTLGTYPNTMVAPGGTTTVTPSAAPSDQGGSIASVTATALPATFTGTLTANTATGAVTINNANPPGGYTITVVATDNCGQATSRSFTLTVSTPNNAPTINAVAITRIQNSPSASAQIATANDVEDAAQSLLIQLSSDGSTFGNTAMSNGVTISLIDQNAGATGSNPDAMGQVFTNVVASCTATNASFTLKVSDSLGAMTTTTLTVTVTPEQQAPTIVCPANQVGVTNLNAPNTPIAVTWPTPSVNDNCAGATNTCTPPSGATFPLGTTTVTCTATDAAGNQSAACSFTVTVRQSRSAVRDLITKVRALAPGTLTTAQANQLVGHLELANSNLERGQTAAACTNLQNFVNQVNAMTTPNGPLSSAQAQSLLDYANKIRTACGCPNAARAETMALFNGASGASQFQPQLTAEQTAWIAQYSQAGDVPVAGDWDGDGTDTLGVFRNGVFYLHHNNQLSEEHERERKGGALVIEFGWPGDVPVVGDWDGDGIDTIGVFRAGLFLLRNTNAAGEPDVTLYLGQWGDVPLAGDWDGDGQDSVGIYTAATGIFQLRNGLADGAAEIVVPWGGAAYLPVVGDWDGNGVTTIGLYGPSGEVLLRNTNTVGPPEIILPLGLTGGLPVVGKWAGQP